MLRKPRELWKRLCAKMNWINLMVRESVKKRKKKKKKKKKKHHSYATAISTVQNWECMVTVCYVVKCFSPCYSKRCTNGIMFDTKLIFQVLLYLNIKSNLHCKLSTWRYEASKRGDYFWTPSTLVWIILKLEWK